MYRDVMMMIAKVVTYYGYSPAVCAPCSAASIIVGKEDLQGAFIF